jgi:hypothetical protein
MRPAVPPLSGSAVGDRVRHARPSFLQCVGHIPAERRLTFRSIGSAASERFSVDNSNFGYAESMERRRYSFGISVAGLVGIAPDQDIFTKYAKSTTDRPWIHKSAIERHQTVWS